MTAEEREIMRITFEKMLDSLAQAISYLNSEYEEKKVSTDAYTEIHIGLRALVDMRHKERMNALFERQAERD